jgi:hypothetical protein
MKIIRVFRAKVVVAGGLTLLITTLSAATAWAQMGYFPAHREAYWIDSGTHDGMGAKSFEAFREVVQAPQAPWLRLHFSEYDLGAESFLTITALKDGGQQRLDAVSMVHYRSSSVYFNGDAVEVALHVAPQDRGVYVRMNEITVGEWVGGQPIPKHLCSGDSRVSSTVDAVGRIVDVNAGGDTVATCTGFIVSNGTHLTAGHCRTYNIMDIIQFNVPSSLSDGTIQHPGGDDQYSINFSSIVWDDDTNGTNCPGVDCGQDWAVFACHPNSSTGLLPVQAQGLFYRMSRDDTPDYLDVTGYGDDYVPVGSTGFFNSDNYTQQTDWGDYVREVIEANDDVVVEYLVDSRPGNSGSPVIPLGYVKTIGIHTDGGCNRPDTGNFGTSFENDSLEVAIHTFPGDNVVYVDYYTYSNRDGTVLRPYETVFDAYKNAPSGSIISIVSGIYSETITITRPITLMAPVGTVVIGQ